jgi:dUTP pyrophosphatase
MNAVICSKLENINFPSSGDVGYDLIACSDPKIVGEKISSDSPYYESIDYIEYDVDLKIQVPHGYHTLIYPRSSISKYNLQLCNSVGVIDNGYRGDIKVRFNYLTQPKHLERLKYIKDSEPLYIYENFVTEIDFDKIYKKGDKIAQMVFSPSYIPKLEVGDLNETNRGEGGFGSTGK